MSDENLVQYSVYGSMVTDGEGFMGLFSTVNLLNDKIEEIQKLQAQLDEANKVIEKLARNGVSLSVHTEARRYLEKYKVVSNE
jgi:hypothetical protein